LFLKSNKHVQRDQMALETSQREREGTKKWTPISGNLSYCLLGPYLGYGELCMQKGL
jgi:hypothetical protein